MAQLVQLSAETKESGHFGNLVMDLKCHDPALYCNITKAEKNSRERSSSTNQYRVPSSKAFLLLDVIKLEESFDFALIPLFLFKRSFQKPNIFSLIYHHRLT